MATIWLALLSGTVGALLASALAFGTQFYLARRAERQQSDRVLVATALEFTGRSSAIVMWAAYLHVHVSKATNPMTLPAVLIRQFSTVDLGEVASTAVAHVTELVLLRGHLVATEGRSVESLVDRVVMITLQIVEGYLSPAESRPAWKRWLVPFPPADLTKLRALERERVQACQELEMVILSRCSTLKGRELARRSQSSPSEARSLDAGEESIQASAPAGEHTSQRTDAGDGAAPVNA